MMRLVDKIAETSFLPAADLGPLAFPGAVPSQGRTEGSVNSVAMCSSNRSAIGVEDSPMANRGCSLASMRTTRTPREARIWASSEPLKPAPMMPTSYERMVLTLRTRGAPSRIAESD